MNRILLIEDHDRLARLMWRICRIDGRPSRYRSEPPVAFAGRD